MTGVWVAMLVLAQAPAPAPAEAPGTQLQLDVDAEVAFVTRAGEYDKERGESGGGMVSAWAAGARWRAGLATRVLNIANDPFGNTNPFAADLLALAGYRVELSRFTLGPELGGGLELFWKGGDLLGPLLEAAVEARFRIDETWAVRFRFGFTVTPTLQVSAYWRWSLGVEWGGPL